MNLTSISHSPIDNLLVPTVLQRTTEGERAYDLFSRLLEDRIIMLCDEVNSATAQIIISELLYLESRDSTKDIYFYINSPGGEVSSGLAIYDTMNYIKCDVHTICFGTAASMGAVLFAAGTKGKRTILPSAKVMIHQPLGGTQGQASDMQIDMEEMVKCKKYLMQILADKSGKDIDTVTKDCDRNHWLNAQETVDYGLADNIQTTH